MVIITIDRGRLSMVCAECPEGKRKGWSVPMTNADAVAAAVGSAADHGHETHDISPKIIDRRK